MAAAIFKTTDLSIVVERMTKDQLSKIHEFVGKEMKRSDIQHNFDHIDRVRKNALRIIRILGVEKKVDKNLLQAACLLHDLVFTEHAPGLVVYFFEGYLVKKKAQYILDAVGVGQKDQKIIINAIVRHSLSFPFRRLNKNRDVYTKVLQDADTLDYFHSERIKNLKVASRKSPFYRILSLFSNLGFNYGKKNMEKFLNFPELATLFYEQTN